MTRRGQWYDFTTKTGTCEFGIPRGIDTCGCLKTHVVKWPPTLPSTASGRLRHYTCAHHAARIVAHQKTLGVDVRAYRYRKG